MVHFLSFSPLISSYSPSMWLNCFIPEIWYYCVTVKSFLFTLATFLWNWIEWTIDWFFFLLLDSINLKRINCQCVKYLKRAQPDSRRTMHSSLESDKVNRKNNSIDREHTHTYLTYMDVIVYMSGRSAADVGEYIITNNYLSIDCFSAKPSDWLINCDPELSFVYTFVHQIIGISVTNLGFSVIFMIFFFSRGKK